MYKFSHNSGWETFCCEDISLIENYEKAIDPSDSSEWHIHHRLETHDEYGNRRSKDLSKSELIENGLYYNRPAKELIFLSKSDHKALHMENYSHSEETRRKLSEAKLGHLVSEETRRKISEAQIGKILSEETKQNMRHPHKSMSEISKQHISEGHKGHKNSRHIMSVAWKDYLKTHEYIKFYDFVPYYNEHWDEYEYIREEIRNE